MRALPGLVCLALSAFPLAVRGGEGSFDYILWCGHRFGNTPAEQERDLRYYRDLGFTHSLVGASLDAKAVAQPEAAGRFRSLAGLFDRYDMIGGLRYGWESAWLDEPPSGRKSEYLDKGYYLRPERQGNALNFNPLHPEVIRGYTDRFAASVKAYRELDEKKRIGFFLIGSEFTWELPPSNAVTPAARALILAAAREDGVLAAGEDDWSRLGEWWSNPKSKGRDWRLRAAIADVIRKEIPDAGFMIDPLWAVKLPGDTDFGGTWSYLGEGYPEGVADEVIRIKAMCWPNPATHSTQLIRGACHDLLLESNFLSLCLGIDKLYHWGLNTFEPGRRANPAYGKKDWKPAPAGFPRFTPGRQENRPEAVEDWNTLCASLSAAGKSGWGRRILARLDPAARGLLDTVALDPEVPAALQTKLIAVLDEAVAWPDLFDAAALKGLPLSTRGKSLLARAEGPDPLSVEHRLELNRHALEAALPGLRRTPSPNLFELVEDMDADRLEKEPALRTTGRFLRERGALLREWKPLPGMAVVGGLHDPSDTRLALLAAHIPFDLLRNRHHRLSALPASRTVLVMATNLDADIHAALVSVAAAGGAVILPKGYAAPAGGAPLAGARQWDPEAVGARLKSYKGLSTGMPFPDFKAHIYKGAGVLRAVLADAGFKAYFDSGNPDVIMRGYSFRGRPMLFAVNNRRSAPRVCESNEVEFLVRETADGLRVIDIDTGADLPLSKGPDGYRFRDVLPPAWYRIYAVLKPGERVEGLAPLAAGPAIRSLKAARAGEGVRLAWEADVPDWPGCDIQWIRIWRGGKTGELVPIKDLYGRDVAGPGGLVATFLDRTAPAGRPLVYRIQTITPLRRPGPLSETASVE